MWRWFWPKSRENRRARLPKSSSRSSSKTKPSIGVFEIAGPGFINLRLKPEVWQNEVREILRSGMHYGDSESARAKVNVEYVSANPTGPMHVGHVRGAVIGDVLALCWKSRLRVCREYYSTCRVRRSMCWRVPSFCVTARLWAKNIGDIPEGFYPGEYLIAVGGAMAERYGKKWLRSNRNPTGCRRSVRVRGRRHDAAASATISPLSGVKHDVFTIGARAWSRRTASTRKILESKGSDLSRRPCSRPKVSCPTIGSRARNFVPRHAIRRRLDRPLEKIGWQLDLFCLRHRLSSR